MAGCSEEANWWKVPVEREGNVLLSVVVSPMDRPSLYHSTHTQIIPPKDILAEKKLMSGDKAHLVCVCACVCVCTVGYTHEYVMEILWLLCISFSQWQSNTCYAKHQQLGLALLPHPVNHRQHVLFSLSGQSSDLLKSFTCPNWSVLNHSEQLRNQNKQSQIKSEMALKVVVVFMWWKIFCHLFLLYSQINVSAGCV